MVGISRVNLSAMTSYLRRITPSMAVAILALVIAVSSSATAALVISGKQIKDHSITGKDLKKNAVKSKTIKNKTVKGKDLKKGAVKSVQVSDHSLTSTDIKAGSLTNESLADGTLTSSKLSTSLLQTISGTAGFQIVTVESEGTAPILSRRTATATCPAGKIALSANAYTAEPVIELPPVQIRRESNTRFTAEDVNPLSVLGAGPLVIQVTCVSG